MKLTIVAATGGIGRHLLEQAVAAGHDVTAAVRRPEKLTEHVPSVTVDLARPDLAALETAVAGTDAVLSALGPRSKADAGVATRGTQALVTAMRVAGVQRLIVVSAAPMGTVPSPARPNPPRHDPGDGFLMRHVLSRIAKVALRDHYADLARMEDVVRASGLHWTISRPPRLTDKPLTGRYRTALDQNVRGGRSVSRADTAHHMLHVLSEPETVGRTVGIAA